MREYYRLVQTNELPFFLEKYMPKCKRVVEGMKNRFLNASEKKLDEFTRHLIISFYLEHVDV